MFDLPSGDLDNNYLLVDGHNQQNSVSQFIKLENDQKVPELSQLSHQHDIDTEFSSYINIDEFLQL